MELPRISKKEHQILDLLRSGNELFGLQMVRESDGALKRGTIYVTLGRMVEKGLIETRQDVSENLAGLPRRKYKISGAGRAAIEAADSFSAALGGLSNA